MVKKHQLYAILTVLFNCHILKFDDGWDEVRYELDQTGDVDQARTRLIELEPKFYPLVIRFNKERHSWTRHENGLPRLPLDVERFFLNYYGVNTLEDEVFILQGQKGSFDQIEFVRW